MQSTPASPAILERDCCGIPMEIHLGTDRWGMMDFDHEYLFDMECHICGKEIFDIPG